jgi:hypothetical protein
MLKTRANQSNVQYYYCTVHPLTPSFAVAAAAASAAFLYYNNPDHNIPSSQQYSNE